jgi:hypothetical protein
MDFFHDDHDQWYWKLFDNLDIAVSWKLLTASKLWWKFKLCSLNQSVSIIDCNWDSEPESDSSLDCSNVCNCRPNRKFGSYRIQPNQRALER